MDLKLFATAFFTVFVAELGDKTQLATLAMATQPGAKWMVFIGAALALVCTTALAVLVSDLFGHWFRPQLIKRGAGILFLLLGALYIKDSFS